MTCASASTIFSGRPIRSSRPLSIHVFGVNSAVPLSSSSMTKPSRRLISRRPRLPSVPIPDSRMPTANSPKVAATLLRSVSSGLLGSGFCLPSRISNRKSGRPPAPAVSVMTRTALPRGQTKTRPLSTIIPVSIGRTGRLQRAPSVSGSLAASGPLSLVAMTKLWPKPGGAEASRRMRASGCRPEAPTAIRKNGAFFPGSTALAAGASLPASVRPAVMFPPCPKSMSGVRAASCLIRAVRTTGAL